MVPTEPKVSGRIVLVYPQQGFSGNYVRHMPLSLLYAASRVVKAGFEVTLLDTRVHADWHDRLARLLAAGETLCVGVSVMSGQPIRSAIAIGRQVKELAPDVPVVWGGPHATFHPEGILEEPACDYVISGYGAQPFLELCEALDRQAPVNAIAGLSWRENGGVRRNPPEGSAFETIDWHHIPYHLIEDFAAYGQLDQDKRIFPMYSALGCPYKCSFCSSPAQYAAISGKKWVTLEAKDVADHVAHVVAAYGASYIYFIDDDSFPSLEHVRRVIAAIRERNLPVKLGFRGARINEIKRMSDEFLAMLAEAGTDILHIGAESGSDRILELIRKDCTAQDIIEVNRKLARHPRITAAYNFIMGLPTETLEDVKRTRDLMLRLVDDNPNCLVFPPNTFRPLPGTELYEHATRLWDCPVPATLEEWADIEVEGDNTRGRYDKAMERFFRLMLVTSYFIDDKIMKMTSGRTAFFRLARLANLLYRPIARFRLRHGITALLIEYWLYRWATRLLVRRQRKT